MRYVTDELRKKISEQVDQLSPTERCALALRIAEADLRVFQSSQQLYRRSAVRFLQKHHQKSRRPKSCFERLIE